MYFYCYSVKMKDFLKSMGFVYIKKEINPSTNKPYFLFTKSNELNNAILLWNKIKFSNLSGNGEKDNNGNAN